MLKKFRLILFFLSVSIFSLVFTNNSYAASEYIDSYNTLININPNGVLDVTEEITVNALGQQIKRGIYRDFPTEYVENGKIYKVGFKVKEVLKDGEPEKYQIEILPNGKRLYIGEQNTFIPHGMHTYTIVYETNRQIGFFDQHDELFYNAISNDWNFNINNANVKIVLPPGVPVDAVQIEGFTGGVGEKGTDYQSEIYEAANNRVVAEYRTTNLLKPAQGFSVAAGWPKGYIRKPTQSENLSFFIQDYPTVTAGIACLLIIIIYFFVAWLLYGRDPKGRLTFAEYEPPHGLSPAVVRYINNMDFDNELITAALVSMAVKGYLKIVEQRGKFSVELIGNNENKLSHDESIVSDSLFKLKGSPYKKELMNKMTDSGIIKNDPDTFINMFDAVTNRFQFDPRSSATLSVLKERLQEFLSLNYDSVYVNNNKHFLIPAGILILGYVFYLISLSGEEYVSMLIFLVFPVAILIPRTLQFLKSFSHFPSNITSNIADGIKSMLYLVLVMFVFLPIFGGILSGSGKFDLLLLFFMIVTFIIFYKAIKVRTVEGRDIQDHILGLKKFLTATEDLRYSSSLHKEMPHTLKVYEKYLPYAIALDVEPVWTKRFKKEIESVLEVNKNNKSGNFWYIGDHDFNSKTFGFNLSSSLTSSISAASVAPGTRSGFGGGGGVGGGGGGGGGGGW